MKLSINDFAPNDFDLEELSEKGLYTDGFFSEKFNKIYVGYSKYLMNYINKKINIKEYDDKIFSSDLGITKVKRSDMDVYQFISDYNYFYIRNTLYVEKLSKEDIFLLEEKIDNNVYDIEVEKIIERTYQEVIKTSCFGDGEYINYGDYNVSRRYYAPNNELVLGFRYDKFPGIQISDNDFVNFFFNQAEYIDEVLGDFTSKNNMIHVIMYDENTAHKLFDNQDIVYTKS